MEKFIYEAPAVETLELAAEAAYCIAASVGGSNTEKWEDSDF